MPPRLPLVSGIVLILALAGWWWWSWATRDLTALPSTPPAPSESAGQPAVDAATIAESADLVVRTVDDLASAVSNVGPTARLHGRCVDAEGAPMAGCTVRLRGAAHDETRKEAWLRDHRELPPPVEPPATTTGTDGRFEFVFWPPSPFGFTLSCRLAGHCEVTGTWSTLAPGSTTDVGDLQLLRGVRVVGRLVDERGQGMADRQVRLTAVRDRFALGQAGGPLSTRAAASCGTANDGSFATKGWLPPGDYEVSSDGNLRISPAQVTLPAGSDEFAMTLVATTPATAALPKLSGRVVDGDGRPIANARVECRSTPRGTPSALTARDGTFTLQAAADTPERSVLAVDMEGFEPFRTQEPILWHSVGVELRLQRGPALTIRVVDPDENAVADYTVRVVPRKLGRWSGDDSRVRARGPYQDGTATVAGLQTGEHLLIVEFPTATGWATWYEPLQMQGDRRLDLRASAGLQRPVRVVDAAGLPVPGARLQLCEMFGGSFSPGRRVLSREIWLRGTLADHILVVHEDVTGDDGRALLRNASPARLALCLPGPGHVAATVEAVDLTAATELVVVVSRGARLQGRLIPREAVAHLRRFDEHLRPADRLNLRLQGRRGARFPDPDLLGVPGASPNAIDADGNFVLQGIPPGAWDCALTYHDGPDPKELYSRSLALGRLTLVDGDNPPAEFDISAMLPGTLAGLVLHNGLPLAHGRLQLRSPSFGHPIGTDAEGRFRLDLPAAEYRVELAGSAALAADSSAIVVRGQTTEHTFSIASATLQLELLTVDGTPATNAQVRLHPRRDFLATAEPGGTLDCVLAPGSYRLQVLPAALGSPAAMHELTIEGMQKQLEDPFAAHLLDCGEVHLRAGETRALRVVVPAGWK